MSRENLHAKVDRADELRAVIEHEINAYLLGGPFQLRDQVVPDPPRFEVFVESVTPPPPRLGVLVGDFVHNLRSVLNHLVWQLALTQVAEPSRDVQFPIRTKRGGRASVVETQLRDVPAEAVAVIERMQPYHAENPAGHPLAELRKLSNEDRHEVIPEAMSVPVEPNPEAFSVEGETSPPAWRSTSHGQRPTNQGRGC